MFEKLVGIEALRLPAKWEAKLRTYAKQVELFTDLPENDAEIIRRIGGADAVLVSHSTPVSRQVLLACPNIRYIGMCCSLYSPLSANVDILAAKELNIEVKGVRDYGDEGVAEYAVSGLVRLLHGFGDSRWKDEPLELTGVKTGIIGMGATGQIIARALQFFGAEISYYSRTQKPELEETLGYKYLPLEDLLRQAEIAITCLTKNTVLLDREKLGNFGAGKILMNISIGASFQPDAIRAWLGLPGTFLLADSLSALGGDSELLAMKNVICPNQSAGMTTLAKERLAKKVLGNIEEYIVSAERGQKRRKA
jgi:lactate dehydrogenase-like 2-hydroxyacid dehydrogenase